MIVLTPRMGASINCETVPVNNNSSLRLQFLIYSTTPLWSLANKTQKKQLSGVKIKCPLSGEFQRNREDVASNIITQPQ